MRTQLGHRRRHRSDLKLHDDIERILKLRLADAAEIDAAIRHHYGVGAEIIEQIIDDRDLGGRVTAESGEADADLGDQTVEASIIKFVNQILLDAYRNQATDIHFEPFESCYRIRKRIDGVLYEVPIPASLHHFQYDFQVCVPPLCTSRSRIKTETRPHRSSANSIGELPTVRRISQLLSVRFRNRRGDRLKKT